MVMVDIAVPRDIEPGVAKLPHVYLYNIDDLQEVAAGNRVKRDREIAVARELLTAHVDEYLRWFAARDMGPLVKALYDHAKNLGQTEIEAHLARHLQEHHQHVATLEPAVAVHRQAGGPVVPHS